MDGINFDNMYNLINQVIYDRPLSIDKTIYHYTSAKNITNILQARNIHIRMTHFEDFDDKLEGKVVDAYLDLALEKLLKEGKIDYSMYSNLIPQNAPSKDLFTFNQPHQPTHSKMLEYDVYIACFCKIKNHQYMYDNYANKEGYCISFSQFEIKSTLCRTFGKGYLFEYQPIFYGEEVVEYFYDKILLLLSAVENLPNKTDYLQSVLHIIRNKVQYSSKLYKYSNEKEVRFILKVPKEHKFNTNYPFVLGYNEERGQHFAELTLPKYCCWGLNTQRQTDEISNYLKENNYRINCVVEGTDQKPSERGL